MNKVRIFPFRLDLGKGTGNVPFLNAPFRNPDSSGHIVVTDAYVEMLRRILYLRAVNAAGGIVLTGQPGVGASL